MNLSCVRIQRGRLAALISVVGVTASILIGLSSPAEAARRRQLRGGYNPPYADMVVDVKTGRTLHAVNENELRHPASITKVMTLYLLFEQLERGRMSLDTPLQVSAFAASQAPSKLGLRPGGTIEVEDAIKAIVTKSANDVAVVIAENIAGSEDAFAEQMTRKARALGMSRTVYRNASGLPDPEQVTTARDLTILARAIQDRFPKYYPYFQTRVFHYAGRSIPNHNRLIGRVEGVDGIKTGYTRASGFNLMTSARTEDQHVVAIVLGGRSGAVRDKIMADLVRSNLPRAYAGARSAPTVAEARPAAPVAVAEARLARPEVETTAATTHVQASKPRPLDLNAMRPVVASAAGAASTTTPSSMRWSVGPQGVPQSAQAYAPVQTADASSRPMPLPSAAPSGKIEARLPTAEAVAPAKADTRADARADIRTEPPHRRLEPARAATPSGWMIQLGAMDDEGKAKSMLERAKSQSGKVLAHASPFTEKVVRDGTTLYRARFSGFGEADAAQEACQSLKRSGFACFATRG